jgi:hypothetical protein
MVLYHVRYTIDKDKVDAYTKFSKEVAIPHWLSTPGLKEFRAYRETGTLNALVEMEFDSYMSWGKALDNPKTKNMMTKFTMHIHDLCWDLWDKSPIVPGRLKPKK